MSIHNVPPSNLRRRVERLERIMHRLQSDESSVVLGRTVAGGIAAVTVVTLLFNSDTVWLWLILGLSSLVFSYFVCRHASLRRRQQVFTQWKEIYIQRIARIERNWQKLRAPRLNRVADAPEYVQELGLVGTRSLHQLIDTTTSLNAATRLATWLCNHNSGPDAIVTRQRRVGSLSTMRAFRDRLQLLGLKQVKVPSEATFSFDAALLQNLLKEQPSRRIFGLLALLCTITLVLAAMRWLLNWPAYWFPVWLVYLAVYSSQSRHVRRTFNQAFLLERDLMRFYPVARYLERYSPKDAETLAPLFESFKHPAHRPSQYLECLRGVVAGAAWQRNVPGLAVNMLMPIGMYYALRLRDVARDLEHRMARWLDAWFELDAHCALAELAAIEPHYTFPSIIPDVQGGSVAAFFQATQLGHPLLERNKQVRNNIRIDSARPLIVLTGSNMSGKSTFMRALGMNVSLAMAGSVVNADALRTVKFGLCTCMEIRDSLHEGKSRFYAEVVRLRELWDLASGGGDGMLFYLVDEIFEGTNDEDRFVGSQQYIDALSATQAVGVISTHDSKLAKWAENHACVESRHFSELVAADGQITFDYVLKHGRCRSKNALRIMQNAGLPVRTGAAK